MGWTKTLASPRVQGSPAAFKVKYFGSQHNMENIVFSNTTAGDPAGISVDPDDRIHKPKKRLKNKKRYAI
jgi:hypothetical protein